MGSLTPGATLIYERVGDTVYSRESGADPSTRTIVGSSLQPEFANSILDRWELEEWKHILKEAKTNTALQTAIHHVKVVYHLSKDNFNE